MTAGRRGTQQLLIGRGCSSLTGGFQAVVKFNIRSRISSLNGAHLCLDIFNPVSREDKLVQWNLGLLQIPQEAELALQQEQQALSNLSSTRGTTHSMDVITGIIWRIILHNIIYSRNIETTSGNIGTQ